MTKFVKKKKIKKNKKKIKKKNQKKTPRLADKTIVFSEHED